jgi:hypothetical protein
MKAKQSLIVVAIAVLAVLTTIAFRQTTSVHAQSGQLSYAHAAGCGVVGAGRSCIVTASWVPAFSDTNYFPVCGGANGANSVSVLSLTKTASTIQVQVLDVQPSDSQSNATASVVNVNCIAIHQ